MIYMATHVAVYNYIHDFQASVYVLNHECMHVPAVYTVTVSVQIYLLCTMYHDDNNI